MSISGLIIGAIAWFGLFIYFAIIYLVDFFEWHNIVYYWNYYYPGIAWISLINFVFVIFGFILSLAGTIKGNNRLLGILGLILCASALIYSIMTLPAPGVIWGIR